MQKCFPFPSHWDNSVVITGHHMHVHYIILHVYSVSSIVVVTLMDSGSEEKLAGCLRDIITSVLTALLG